MLTSLSIKNYALIDDLNITFTSGLSVITGETGAGKSILLDALSLVLGKRADMSSVKNAAKKCVIEAEFDIANYNLKKIFKTEDLDYETQTIIRREILPSGKSRAFVNDTPVNLNSLQTLSSFLLDIHSQHQTLELTNEAFQFNIIDALSNNSDQLIEYAELYKKYKQLQKELTILISSQAEFSKELDYNLFLLNELEEARLDTVNLIDLEETYHVLSNAEDIKDVLGQAHSILSDEQIGTLSTLKTTVHAFQKLSGWSKKYEELYTRINSVYIELDDVFSEIENANTLVEDNPELLDNINTQLQGLNNLLQKHAVVTVEELIDIKTQLQEKVSLTENSEATIENKQNEILQIEKALNNIAAKIHTKRIKVVPELINQLEALLSTLGMPNAQFNIEIIPVDTYLTNGKDQLTFLFSANKGSAFKDLKKVASGGELSRIMLSIKYILSKYIKLPTIMFDEIDTGVSGEIATAIAKMLLQMRNNMQVFSITHAPQIAAKGDAHFKVYKEDVNELTTSNLIKLNEEERIVEIAQMLGGRDVSNSAIAHAKQLLN